MGVWGAGNFEADGALDYLGMALVGPLVRKMRSVVANPSLAEGDERTSAEIMVAVEILCLLCEQCDAVPPSPEEVEEAETAYLSSWDGYIDKLRPDPDYKRDRRQVISSTFRRLHALATIWHSS
jgi:hypothetical protein